MPDATLARGLIGSAKSLCPANMLRRPKQANLRRAVSAAYYAVFHELALTCANALVGTNKSNRSNKAWVEVYRGLEHGATKKACQRARRVGFPQEIKDFADAFEQLQEARHAADYDPIVRLSKVEALGYITLAEDSIASLKQVIRKDKVAFATWVLITSKGADTARRRAGDPNVNARRI